MVRNLGGDLEARLEVSTVCGSRRAWLKFGITLFLGLTQKQWLVSLKTPVAMVIGAPVKVGVVGRVASELMVVH